ncbi:putative MRN complex-interacting protein [Helianthus debilis subsp. tardiflorus]
MSTVFIAVQCFQCSTMQVKQRKKSSNKWTCVVCNAKQSVRKVFSQAFMAKDVRKFVQTFNMSRQFVEQQQELREQQTLGHDHSEVQVHQPSNKRSDWSEYVDVEVNEFGSGDDEGELCEPNFVTELPKPLFKKPKLWNNYSADCENGEKLQRPVFQKRNTKKNFNNPGKEPGTIGKGRFGDSQHNDDTVDHCSVYGRSSSMRTDIMRRSSKSGSCDDDGDRGFTDTGSSSVMAKLKRPVSKWNNFIDDDDDDESRCEDIVNDAAFETKVSDEIVEDDVHPDFM